MDIENENPPSMSGGKKLDLYMGETQKKKLKEMFILAKSVLIVLKSVVEILFDLLKV